MPFPVLSVYLTNFFPRPLGKSDVDNIGVCVRGCHVVTGKGL